MSTPFSVDFKSIGRAYYSLPPAALTRRPTDYSLSSTPNNQVIFYSTIASALRNSLPPSTTSAAMALAESSTVLLDDTQIQLPKSTAQVMATATATAALGFPMISQSGLDFSAPIPPMQLPASSAEVRATATATAAVGSPVISQTAATDSFEKHLRDSPVQKVKGSKSPFQKYQQWLRQQSAPSSLHSSPVNSSPNANSPVVPNEAPNTPEMGLPGAKNNALEAAKKLNAVIAKLGDRCPIIPHPGASKAKSVLRITSDDAYQLGLSPGTLKVESALRPDVLQHKHMHNCWLVNARRNAINPATYALQPALQRAKTQIEIQIGKRLEENIKTRLGTLQGFWSWMTLVGKNNEPEIAREFLQLHNQAVDKYNHEVRALRESHGIATHEDEFYTSKLFKDHFQKEFAALAAEVDPKQESNFKKFLKKLEQLKNKKNKIVKGEFSIQQALEKAHPDYWPRFKVFIKAYTKQNQVYQANPLVVDREKILKKIENDLWDVPRFKPFKVSFENPQFLARCVAFAKERVMHLIQEDERHSFARFPLFFKIHMAFQHAIFHLSATVKGTLLLFSPRAELGTLIQKKFTDLCKKQAEADAKSKKTSAKKGLYRQTQGKHSPGSRFTCDSALEKMQLLFTALFNKNWVDDNFEFQDAHLMVYPGIFSNRYLEPSQKFTSPKMSSFSAERFHHLKTDEDTKALSEAHVELIKELSQKHSGDPETLVHEAVKTILWHCLMLSSSVDHLPSICNDFDHIVEVDIETRMLHAQKNEKAKAAADYKTLIRQGFLKLIQANKLLNLKETMDVFQDYMKGCGLSLKAGLGNRLTRVDTASLDALLKLSLVVNRCFALVDIYRQVGQKVDIIEG